MTLSSTIEVFTTRLATLEHLLDTAGRHFAGNGDEFLAARLAPDMHPLGTQVAFTCNQPRNLALWASGAAASDLDPDVTSLVEARAYIHMTQAALAAMSPDDALLDTSLRLDLGGGLHAELTGAEYVQDFLLPNFYFHLVTAYGILRMSGLPIGKRDYMLHLLPRVRRTAT